MSGVEKNDDTQLLRAYAVQGDQAAFAEVVRRHIDLVFSVALRRTGGDAAWAEDIAQKVFADLAAKARRLPSGVVLAGWLHRHACFVAGTALRTEIRRRQREKAYVEMNALEADDSPPDWARLALVLENAMEQLSDRDRDAVLLRFFKQQPLREVGDALGVSEDAARMRVDRALTRLREALAQRGVKTAGAALSLALSAQAVTAAPAGLAASLATGALAAAATGATSLSETLLRTLVMSKAKVTVLSALVVAAVSVPVVLQYPANTRLRAQRAQLQEELQQLTNSPPAMIGAAVPPVNVFKPPVPPATNAAQFNWQRVESSDYRRYIANLRAIGCPEKTLRDIITADVGELFRERLRALMPTNRAEYWKPGVPLIEFLEGDIDTKLHELAAEQRTLLQALLGGNFPDQTEALLLQRGSLYEERVLDFLTSEKQSAARQIDQQFGPRLLTACKEAQRGNLDGLRQVLAAKDAAMLQRLTPGEKFEYDLRRSRTADLLLQKVGRFAPTEQEFREMFRLQQKFDDAFAPMGYAAPQGDDPRYVAARSELQAGFKAVLGEERYRAWISNLGR